MGAEEDSSVALALSGAKTASATEGAAPYSLYGDRGSDDYVGEALPDGSYTVSATAYAGPRGTGAAQPPVTRRFTVRRPRVAVRMAADTSPVAEGAAAAFTLTRTGPIAVALRVSVTVAESGEMLASGVPASVEFAVGQATATLVVPTVDDDADEADTW